MWKAIVEFKATFSEDLNCAFKDRVDGVEHKMAASRMGAQGLIGMDDSLV